MLLSEMVRKIREEERLVNDPTVRSTGSTSYTTVASYNITLSKSCILIYRYEQRSQVTSSRADCRLKIGSNYIGGEGTTSTTYVVKNGLFALNAGSYTVEVQLRSSAGGSSYAYIQNFVLGAASFSDVSLTILRDYGSSDISLPSRRTCAGSTSKATLYIQVYSISAPTVTVDGNTVSAYQTDTEKYVYAVSVLTGSHTINVSAGNYSAVMSPWLLPASDSEFISLRFPQGSTLYLVLEPLWDNPTKTVKLGKRRAVSFGDSTDFYSAASGTGILSWNYTFESVEVEQAVLLVSGYGGCISIIAIDVRS